MPSFDAVLEPNLVELKNAVDGVEAGHGKVSSGAG